MRSLFIIGDSISIQYGPHLKKMVEGWLHYGRKRGEAEALNDLDRPAGTNGGDSISGSRALHGGSLSAASRLYSRLSAAICTGRGRWISDGLTGCVRRI